MTLDPSIKQEFKEYLDTQIEEKVKSIQIKYLKDHFLTKEEFLDSMKQIDKRFEAMQEQMDKRFDAMQEQMDKRFEAMQEQMDKRFEVMQEQMDKRFDRVDKRFEAMQEQIDKRFKRVYERFDQMDFGHTDVVEGMMYIVIKRELKLRGHDVRIKTRQHFTDEKNNVHPDTKDVEIDILHISPNILGEATLKLTDLEKLRTFIRKIQFIESYYGESFERYFFTYSVYENIRGEVESLLEKYQIELIIPERE